MNNSARSKARYYALQTVYQWLITKDEIDVNATFDHLPGGVLFSQNVDMDYFKGILQGVFSSHQLIEAHLHSVIDRPSEQLGRTEYAILTVACYELVFCQDIPYRVVIDEAIKLTKKFAGEESYKYINGVLDNLAEKIRGDYG